MFREKKIMAKGLKAAAFAAAYITLASSSATAAEERVRVRTGDYTGFGRIVLEWPYEVGYSFRQVGDKVRIRFTRPGQFERSAFRRPPRNASGITVNSGVIEISIKPGTRPSVYQARAGEQVIIDLHDPQTNEARPEPPAAPNAASSPTAASGSGRDGQRQSVNGRPITHGPTNSLPPAAGGTAATSNRRPSANTINQTPVAQANPTGTLAPTNAPPSTAPIAAASSPPVPPPPSGAPGFVPPSFQREQVAAETILPPNDSTAVAVRLISASPQSALAIVIPSARDTGMALIRRGDAVFAIFDEPIKLNLTALRTDPTLVGATATVLANAAILRIPLAANLWLRAGRLGTNWTIEAVREQPALQSIPVEPTQDPLARIMLPTSNPSRSMTIPDPVTGLPLLIGTVKVGASGIPQPRRMAEFDLVPTMLGVAILAKSDDVTLRTIRLGFSVEAGDTTGLAVTVDIGPVTGIDTSSFSRLFNFPSQSTEATVERVRENLATVASTPPLARGPARVAASQALMALGLPQEAHAMMALAFTEDSRSAAEHDAIAISAAAALLSGRLSEATGIEDPRLNGTDEIVLWRSLFSAAKGETAAAAPGFAATVPLLLSYPEGLRARILRTAAETLAEAEEVSAADRLLSAAPAGDPTLSYARARLMEAKGQDAYALSAYDAVANGRDRLARAKAIRRSTEMKLAAGNIGPAEAASVLENALYAWRGDLTEADTRVRIAELKRLAGDVRGAFAMLRETEQYFPERSPMLRSMLTETFMDTIEKASPSVSIPIFDSNMDLIPPGARGEGAILRVADGLVDLDLADRASTLLLQVIQRAKDPETKAALGSRLASVRLSEGDAAGAHEALASTAAENLPEPLASERTVLEARSIGKRGDLAKAAEMLRSLGRRGNLALSDMMAEAQDWQGAATALADHITGSVPTEGNITEGDRRNIARLAAYAALAGDNAALEMARTNYGTRMRTGPLAEAFQVLTSDPMQGLADLPRMQREIDILRAFPRRIDSFQAQSDKK